MKYIVLDIETDGLNPRQDALMIYPLDLVVEDIRGWDFQLQATIDEREEYIYTNIGRQKVRVIDVKDIYIYGMRRTWGGWFNRRKND